MMIQFSRTPAGSGLCALTGALMLFSGCTSDSNGTLPGASLLESGPGAASNPVPVSPAPANPAPAAPTPGPDSTVPNYTTAVLLYEGTGTSASDAQSLESILTAAKISYKAMTSAQINALTASDWATFGMLLVPGGYASTMSASLTSNAITLIQNAVTQGGMGYMGICAGAFLAGDYGSWGLGLASNAFDYYQAEYQGIAEEAVEVSFPNNTQMDLIWYGGPKLDGFGDAVAKYPDGTIAIAEAAKGKGYVLLSGIHAEAPASWRVGMGDTDTTTQDFALLVTLVQATLKHQPLAVY